MIHIQCVECTGEGASDCVSCGFGSYVTAGGTCGGKYSHHVQDLHFKHVEANDNYREVMCQIKVPL